MLRSETSLTNAFPRKDIKHFDRDVTGQESHKNVGQEEVSKKIVRKSQGKRLQSR